MLQYKLNTIVFDYIEIAIIFFFHRKYKFFQHRRLLSKKKFMFYVFDFLRFERRLLGHL